MVAEELIDMVFALVLIIVLQSVALMLHIRNDARVLSRLTAIERQMKP